MVHFYFTHAARGQKTYGFLHTSHSNSTLQLYRNMSSRKAQNNEKWPFFDPLQIRSTNSYKIKQLCFIIQQTSISTLLIMVIHNMRERNAEVSLCGWKMLSVAVILFSATWRRKRYKYAVLQTSISRIETRSKRFKCRYFKFVDFKMRKIKPNVF